MAALLHSSPLAPLAVAVVLIAALHLLVVLAVELLPVVLKLRASLVALERSLKDLEVEIPLEERFPVVVVVLVVKVEMETARLD
jgi:hypothetical protein